MNLIAVKLWQDSLCVSVSQYCLPFSIQKTVAVPSYPCLHWVPIKKEGKRGSKKRWRSRPGNDQLKMMLADPARVWFWFRAPAPDGSVWRAADGPKRSGKESEWKPCVQRERRGGEEEDDESQTSLKTCAFSQRLMLHHNLCSAGADR